MADFRTIHTRIWEDDWFYSLSSEGKVLWVYLLTNHRTSVAGIYQLPQRVIATETNLKNDTVLKLITAFEKEKKIMYAENIIWVKRLRDYQSTSSPKIIKCIENDIAKIKPCIVKNAYLIQHGYPMDTLYIPVNPEIYGMDTDSYDTIPNDTATIPNTNMCLCKKLYSAYPRKIAYANLEKAFKKLNGEMPAEEVLMQALDNSIKMWNSEKRPMDKVPYPASWLNTKPWLDELPKADSVMGIDMDYDPFTGE